MTDELRKETGIKELPDYPGYYVSPFGDVFSDRTWPEPMKTQEQDGYNVISVRVSGKTRRLRVGVLVCTAFNGPRPEGLVLRHLDGNRKNDTPDNLRWGTVSENTKDAVLHGTAIVLRMWHDEARRERYSEKKKRMFASGALTHKGEDGPASKLRTEDVLYIKKRLRDGPRGTQRRLAERYGVAEQTIYCIKTGRTWGHVTI